ncbi:chitinase [Trinickia fusca]|uniref:Chitinase n=2 Tax=Trinickia fusca TaxID=2419777 RepID=A0A494XAW2_9BURK|nr:chitinase [Trinickia fusca]
MKRTSIKVFVAAALSLCAMASQASSIYAPYVDLTAWPTPIVDQIGVQQGIQQFSLAFIVGSSNGCVPSWGGVQDVGPGISSDLLTAIATGISNYRGKGGEVTVSFGGENGTPLMQVCSDVASLQKAIQTVVDTYSLTHIDFDIEGTAQDDLAALARNFQAVAQIQTAQAAKGTPLHVTLTVPVLASGLTQDGLNVVNAAIANNVAIDTVNVMAMDYGGSGFDMGQAAIQAAQSTYSQLDTAYKSVGQTKTNAQLWQLVGVTPMIGVNDTQGETFTLDNAQSLVNAAKNNGYGLLSNWSVGRDQACPGGPGGSASDSCSGVAQTPYQFASILGQFADHWGTGVTKDPNYGGGSGSGGTGGTPAPWSAAKVYTAGMEVTYQGSTYKAQWWTQGDVPGQSSVWQLESGATPTWSASIAYTSGQCVMYQGAKYCAQWWTQGNVPSAGGVWVKQG